MYTKFVGKLEAIQQQWDFSRNKSFDIKNIKLGSNKKFWFLCDNGHSYFQKISAFSGTCTYCNCLEVKHPEITKEWHPTKNGKLKPCDVAYRSSRKVWWVCDRGHEYSTIIANRTIHDNGCPYCYGRFATKENNLLVRFPDIAKEWHPTENKIMPDLVTSKSSITVWWLCNKGHSYKAIIHSRTSRLNCGCPYCSGHKVCIDNCLNTTHPQLSLEWDYNKNTLTPSDVTMGSNIKVWWICNKNHSFLTRIGHRTSSESGCPYCNSMKLCEDNNFEYKYPELAKEWDYQKNSSKPSDFFPFSEKYVWWICPNNHSYKTKIRIRVQGSGCSKCLYKTQEKCRDIFEQLLKKDFVKIKPKWLEGLELDGFNEELKLAFEYDGEWHYNQILKSRDLSIQQKRDRKKTYLCRKNNIKLIRISYKKKNNLFAVIMKKLIKFGFLKGLLDVHSFI